MEDREKIAELLFKQFNEKGWRKWSALKFKSKELYQEAADEILRTIHSLGSRHYDPSKLTPLNDEELSKYHLPDYPHTLIEMKRAISQATIDKIKKDLA